MDLVAPGLSRWTVPHPDWEPADGGPGGWEPDVACLRLDSPDGVVLIDPLAPPNGTDEATRFWEELDGDVAGSGRPVTVVVTLHWHLRSTVEIAERYASKPGVRVWAIDQVAERLGDVVTDVFDDGERLPGGVVGLGPVPIDSSDVDADGVVEEAALWLADQRAVVAGDILVGTPEGLRVWWSDRSDPVYERRVAPFVRRLAELPVEIVLPAHGDPVMSGGSLASERALAASPWAR